MTDLPTVIDSSGLVPTAPATLRSNTVTYATSVSAGITTDLPGTLIEDLTSTTVGALTQIDQARVDAVNSITPYGCNVALLDDMGYIYGVKRGGASNTSAYVTFNGTPGFVVSAGTTVTDGTYSYVVQSSVTLDSSGSSGNVYVLASVSGSWPVAAGSITQITTSIPTGYTLSVTNSAAGTPGDSAGETDTSYRSRIIASGAGSCQSTPRFMKSNISNIAGVSQRLVSVSASDGYYRVMVGGGDPYEVAGAIYQSIADLPSLVGSVNNITSISQEANAVVTTELTHGLTSGNVVISGCQGMNGANGTWAITVIDNNSFSINYNSSSSSAYTGGGVLETNPRNEVVTIIDSPDSYTIPFVVPLQQRVKISIVWNTNSENTVSNDTVSTLGKSSIVSYINGIYAGAPINLFQLQSVFSSSVSNAVPANNLTRLIFTVFIDGQQVSADTGTGIIQGDEQSYLYSELSDITINRG